MTAIGSFCPQTAAARVSSTKPRTGRASLLAKFTSRAPPNRRSRLAGIGAGKRVHVGHRLHDAGLRRKRLGSEYKLPAAPSGGFTLAGATTVIGEFSTPSANAQVIARLYDVNAVGQHPAADRPRRSTSAEPGRWLHQAGLPAAPADLDRRGGPRRQARAADVRTRRTHATRYVAAVDPGARTWNSACRRSKRRAATAASCRRRYRSTCRADTRSRERRAGGARRAAPDERHRRRTRTASSRWPGNRARQRRARRTRCSTRTPRRLETVASGLTSPEYAFGSGNPEAEGTWNYRVTASNEGPESEASAASEAVKVDETAPNAADRLGRPRAGLRGRRRLVQGHGHRLVRSERRPAAVRRQRRLGREPRDAQLAGDVQHRWIAPGERDGRRQRRQRLGAGHARRCRSTPSPPTVEVNCPATAPVGSAASATIVAASDGQSGLASDPSGTVAINTSKTGPQTVEATATDNVGHSASGSCTTQVVNTTVIIGHAQAQARRQIRRSRRTDVYGENSGDRSSAAGLARRRGRLDRS